MLSFVSINCLYRSSTLNKIIEYEVSKETAVRDSVQGLI